MAADGPALIGVLGPIAVGACPVGAESPDRLVAVPGLGPDACSCRSPSPTGA
ncbi:hypothetical protein WDY80_07230 [Gordonia hongkongensis]|uniref:hypothetical protein n=1 Tax=Gordonia TaxID=2053 RepID=UPI000A694694|nr:hypothetical protein [Gordonia sp. UCD-TK1]